MIKVFGILNPFLQKGVKVGGRPAGGYLKLFFKQFGNVGNVTAAHAAETTGGEGQVAGSFEIFGRNIFGAVFVCVENVASFNFSFDFVVKGVAEGEDHHLNTLLGGNGLEYCGIFDQVALFVPFTDNHVAVDEFEKLYIVSHWTSPCQAAICLGARPVLIALEKKDRTGFYKSGSGSLVARLGNT